MTNKLTPSEATVQTMTVEVRVLMIGSRQVTLSVFRQLPNRPIVTPGQPRLNGSAWGRVNYFWGGCEARVKPPHDHLHVVWQCGSELLRSCVERHPPAIPFDQVEGSQGAGLYEAHCVATESWKLAYREIYDRLAALPQLFIAT